MPKSQLSKREDSLAMQQGLKAAVVPLNILFSVFGVFMFFFYVARWYDVALGHAFILGLVAAFTILFVEVILFVLRYNKKNDLAPVAEPPASTFFFQPQYRANFKKRIAKKD